MKQQSETLKLFRQVHMRFAKYFSRKFSSGEVTPPQYMLLMSLMEEGPQKMNALADFLRLSTPAITNLVDKLEAAGYAVRSSHPTDRRAHIIRLTPRGARFIEKLREEHLRLLADTVGEMGGEARKIVHSFYRRLLEKIDASLEAQGGHHGSRRGR